MLRRITCSLIALAVALTLSRICLADEENVTSSSAGSNQAVPADNSVTLTETPQSYKLKNAHCTAVVSKKSGDLISLVYKGIETLGFDSGHPAGYWEQHPANPTSAITIDPSSNSGQRAEVSVTGTAAGGVGGGTFNMKMEVRYSMGAADSGIYTYAIFSHDANSGPGGLGESRYGAKLSNVFDWLSIDAERNRLMPTGADWDHGTPLNMKEARLLTTGLYKGQVDHKYDYSAYQFKIPAFGWSSTKEHIGLYLINPSFEFLSGGATKCELTGHLDNNQGGAPTILDYWRGTHYGGSQCRVAAGEEWNKVVGPIFVYLNSKETPDEMFQDALTHAKKEAAAWPYDWVDGVDYPHKSERGTVTGQLVLNDSQAITHKLHNLLVGLACPDQPKPAVPQTIAPPPASDDSKSQESPPAADQNGNASPGGQRGGRGFGGGRFGPQPLDWQNDAKHYEFWVQGDVDGHFKIPNIRPGTYQLHAIADGVLGEFSQQPIEIKPGQSLDLGKLEWKPVRYGKQLWDIGIPNRTGAEFFKGDEYFRWGWYVEYPKLFPDDVHFEIGKSDYTKDWFFEQVPHDTKDDNPTGQGQGRATPWTITFDLPEQPKGKATLRLAICGCGTRTLDVTVKDSKPFTIPMPSYNATINRDGIGGYWSERDLAFDAALMHAGQNSIVLTVPAGSLTSGVIYDYLRLELDESAAAPQVGQ